MSKMLEKNIINHNETILKALEKLDQLSRFANFTLFVLNDELRLVGTLTDGDIRRSLVKGNNLKDSVKLIMKKEFKSLSPGGIDLDKIKKFRKLGLELVPIIDDNKKVIDLLNLKTQKSFLPIDAIIMAGGEGKRLNPLTLKKPKPMLKIGDKPIIQYNIERLVKYGIKNISISVNYLKNDIIEEFEDGHKLNAKIDYIHEEKKLGTIGSASLVKNLINDYVLIMNSDLLTNIDFEDFYLDFINKSSDMSVATIPYKVKIPYAIMDTENNIVKSFKEKPSVTYYSNAGIYLIKRSVLDLIPVGQFYDATDLMNEIISQEMKLISFPILGYWLDIGKPEDFEKAQEDIKHIKLL